MAFGVVDLFEVDVVGDGFDPALQWNYFVITSLYENGSEFQLLLLDA
jgi:hypothetical protein